MTNFKLPLALFAGATLLVAPAIANPAEAPAEQQVPGTPPAGPEAPAPQAPEGQPEEGAPAEPQG